uniref:ribosome maturation factor RimM n=1 Tax=uncultured Sphingomonas sp. TaxID=158754 RepID=UPI0025D87DE7|nr:ribosome maturation factor RimM [uncultured Sphingomonas sp.]
MTTTRIALAAVAGAHGIRGELRLKLFTDGAESLARHEAVFVGGREHRLLSVKDAGRVAVARLQGIEDRAAAEALRGCLLEVDREVLPPLDEGEYYHADLIGLPCVDQAGTPLGVVSAVENFGAGDLIEVEDEAGKRALVPFKAGIADLENRRIVIDPAFLA